ncbi:MAG: HEAT repeat domain-containing protein [Lysobacteraceae bacterium]
MTLLRSATVALALVALLFAAASARADEESVDYRTGGKRFAKVWVAFYDASFHEPEIDDPLIEAGRPMVPAICEAVAHPDMKYRGYAIGALGYIGDRRALPTLVGLIENAGETVSMRNQALLAIYRIDRALGARYARQYRHADAPVAGTAEAILRGDRSLLEPTEE